MKKYLIPFLFLCLLSCTQEDIFDGQNQSNNMIVLRERPTENPWIPYRHDSNSRSLTRAQERTSLGMRDFLGCSFQFNYSPIVDTRNLGCRIINVNALAKNYPSYLSYWQNGVSDVSSFSFSDFSDYVNKSDFTRTTTSGIDIKFLGFNLAHKKTHTTTFGETLTNDRKSVFGELDIVYRDSCYRINYSPNIRNTIIKNYLDPFFLQELHTLNPYDFYTKYGGVVAFNYCSGGRAIAIYNASSNDDTIDETTETNLNKEINASYHWTDNATGGNLSIGNKNGNNLTYKDKFSSILVSVKTLGGLATSSFSTPNELASSSINLSSWLSSLSDRSRHTISEFGQEGLVSLTDFIIEDNLKELYTTFINGHEPYYKDIIEPYVLINQIWGTSAIPLAYELYISTRFGKYIFLGRLLGEGENAAAWLDECQNMITKVFNIKVVRAMWYPSSVAETYGASNFQNVYYSALFTNPEYYTKISYNGMLYLIDEVNKRGLSIFDNPQVIKEYGLTEFISGLKPATITYSKMIEDGYKLNAL